jgi:hypothetical protein
MYKGNLKNTVNGKIVDNKNSIFLPNGMPKPLIEYADKLSQTMQDIPLHLFLFLTYFR